MSLPKPDLHIRIGEEAKATLGLLADAYELPESVLAARLLERTLLGEGHALRLAARRMVRSGIAGSHGGDE